MSMGVPVYEGDNVEFEYDGSGITKILAIYGSNYKEAKLYQEKLINHPCLVYPNTASGLLGSAIISVLPSILISYVSGALPLG